MLLEDCHESPYLPDVGLRAVSEPANRLVFLAPVGRLRRRKPGWPAQPRAKPMAQRVVLFFFVGIEQPPVAQVPDSMKDAAQALGILVDIGHDKSQIHRQAMGFPRAGTVHLSRDQLIANDPVIRTTGPNFSGPAVH